MVHLLLDEIDLVELLPLGDMPTDVVAMHTHVEYRDDETSAIRRIQLVYPHEADITRGMISVLTLVGADWSVYRAVDPVAEAGWAQTVADDAAGVVAAAR